MSDAPSAPSGEAPTGRVAEEKKNGYTQMATQDGAPPKPKREFESAREAGEELEGRRRRSGNVERPVEEIAYRNRDGSIADEKQTVTLERAAADRKAMLDARAEMAAAVDAFNVADTVEQRRVAEGIAPTEPNQPQLEQPPADPAAQQFESEAVAAGVDPELAKVLRNPQARQALEQEFAKVGQLQAQHSTQVEIAQHFARDAWTSNFPEIANLRADQIGPALARLKQTNPQRFNAAMGAISRVNEMQTLAQHQTAQRAQHEARQFEVDAKLQDQIFERSISHETPQKRSAMAREVLDYAQNMGIDQATLTHLFKTSPIMRNAAMQRVFWDAASARMARREGATYRDKLDRTVPHVQRPGTRTGATTRGVSENLQALARKANADPSLKSMAALLAASRKAR